MIKFWLVILGFIAVIAAAWAAQWAIVMILVAFFLALVLNRPTEFFARVLPGHSRALGATITFLITLVVLFGTITLIIPIFLEQSAIFLKSLPDTIASLQNQTAFLGSFISEYHLDDFYNAIGNSITEQIKSFTSSVGSMSINFLTEAANWIGGAFIVAVLTLFMLFEGPTWVEKFWGLFPDKKKRESYKATADKMYEVVSGYVTGQMIVATINGILAGLGVFVLSLVFGLPTTLILPIAALSFITTFIPMFGPAFGIAIAVILSLLYNPIAAVILLVYMTVYQQILWNFVSPKVQSRQIKISALAILVAIILGLNIGGVFGAIVSVPIAGCLIVLGRQKFYNPQNKENTKSAKKVKSATK